MEDARFIAYTNPRPDITAMVPSVAMEILDVGCSTGALGAALKSEIPGRRVVGIEYHQVFVGAAQERLDTAIHADAGTLDWAAMFASEFASGCDCVILGDVLEHLVDPWKTLREVSRALRPGGCVIVSVPNIRHMSAFYSIYLRGTFPARPRGLFDSTHLRWFTFKDATALLTQAGLEVSDYSCNLRLRDRPEGRVNNFIRSSLGRFCRYYPVREFLAYQYVLKGVPSIAAAA